MGNRIVLVVLGSAVLAASGVVHGLWTGRWKVAQNLEQAAIRLDHVPVQAGDWRGQDLELDAEQVAAANIANHCYRRYQNSKGQQVDILLVVGRPGPISVHTPDICYQGSGYEMAGEPASFSLPIAGAKEAKFQTATFRKPDVGVSGALRIFWSWNATGPWQAPDNPRYTFARHEALYKLYVLREKRPREKLAPDKDPAADFLKAFLPELDRALFPDAPRERSNGGSPGADTKTAS